MLYSSQVEREGPNSQQTAQTDESPMPDTASPREASHSSPKCRPAGWGRLLPINCSLLAKELTDESYTIGRDPSCELLINQYDVEQHFEAISKIHCRIRRTEIRPGEHVVFLEDLSSNGTFINERKLGKNERWVISSNDEISFAVPDNKVFMFVFSAKEANWLPEHLSTKYHVLRHLGTGGFAEVKLVLDQKSCTQFAVKRLFKSGIEETKILNEGAILKKLHHPCIVEMVDLLETPEAAFIVMEYVPDGNLLERLRRDKQFSEPLSKLIFFQLACAVDYMHRQGVTHRDIKPENILLVNKHEGHIIVKVADFGLSKVLSSMTRLKSCCGTLEYTAPEVLLYRGRKQYTSKVDVWGLGIILFICLSGRRPFSSKTKDTDDVVSQILRGRFSLTTSEWLHVSIEAKRLVKKLLTTNPHARMDSQQVLEESWLNDDQLSGSIDSMHETRALNGSGASEPPKKVPKLSS